MKDLEDIENEFFGENEISESNSFNLEDEEFDLGELSDIEDINIDDNQEKSIQEEKYFEPELNEIQNSN